MMIKEAMKTYWKNMKYIVLVMGILFIGLLFGLSVMGAGIGDTVGAAKDEIVAAYQESDLSLERIKDTFGENAKENLFQAISGTLDSYSGFLGRTIEILELGVLKIALCLVVFILLQFVAIIAGHDTVFFKARYDKEDRSIFRTWMELFIKNLFVIVSLIIVIYIACQESTNRGVAIALFASYPLIYCFISLLCEWIAADQDRPKFTSVVTLKNVLILLLENIIVILITAVIAVVAVLAFGLLLGFYLTLTLLILACVSVSLNAQAFVYGSNSWINYLPEEVSNPEVSTQQ